MHLLADRRYPWRAYLEEAFRTMFVSKDNAVKARRVRDINYPIPIAVSNPQNVAINGRVEDFLIELITRHNVKNGVGIRLVQLLVTVDIARAIQWTDRAHAIWGRRGIRHGHGHCRTWNRWCW